MNTFALSLLPASVTGFILLILAVCILAMWLWLDASDLDQRDKETEEHEKLKESYDALVSEYNRLKKELYLAELGLQTCTRVLRRRMLAARQVRALVDQLNAVTTVTLSIDDEDGPDTGRAETSAPGPAGSTDMPAVPEHSTNECCSPENSIKDPRAYPNYYGQARPQKEE